MSKRRRISIVIPAYENETSLNRALNSIADQNYKDIEIIVSDDCSKNANLKKVCDEFKNKNFEIDIQYFYQEKNLRPVPNIKFVLQKANGIFIMLLPHDDFLVDKNFFIECDEIMNKHHDVSCIIANSINQVTKKKLVNSETETWNIVYDNEAFIINFFKNHPAYSAILFKREILYKYGYFNLFFNENDYEKFKYEPDEIMMAPILTTFYGKAIISGKVVSVRGFDGNNFSASDFWEKTYRVSVAMPLMKLYFYFKGRSNILSKYFLKLAVFKYCFFPLNFQTIIYFKKIHVMFIMVFSRLYFKIRPIKIVKYMFDKVFNLKNI